MNAKGEAVVAVRRSVAVSARTHRGKGASSWRAGLRRPHKLPIGRATERRRDWPMREPQRVLQIWKGLLRGFWGAEG